MGSLIREKEQNRGLFRELFFNSQEKLKKRFSELKKNFVCNKCAKCCQCRYFEVSYDEIQELVERAPKWASFFDFFEECKEDNKYKRRVNSRVDGEISFFSCKYANDGGCSYEGEKQSFCQGCDVNFEKVLPEECAYIQWQKMILVEIQDKIFKDILLKYKQMELYKEKFSCNCSGTCCKFACSEFSYDELVEKSQSGDHFAKQFLSVFKPYEDQQKAKEIYPEYVEMLEKKLGAEEKVYFYYCPHLDENNLCTQYEERPDICREFPNNPLSILPEWCGYYAWKEEVEVLAMTLHALVSIGEFYKERLERVI